MTYTVLSGTLNSSIPYHILLALTLFDPREEDNVIPNVFLWDTFGEPGLTWINLHKNMPVK